MLKVNNLIGFGVKNLKPSTALAIRHASQVDIYNVSDWSLKDSFTSLSVGAQDRWPPSGLEISPDDSFFLTNGENGTGAYSMKDGSELFFYANTSLCRPSISKDGKYIAFAGGSGTTTKIYETTGWTEHASFDPSMDVGELYCFSHDGTKLAIATNTALTTGKIKIYETATWATWSNQISIDDAPFTLEFSPDDSLLAWGKDAGSSTNIIQVSTVDTTLVAGDVFEDNMLNVTCYQVLFTKNGSTFIGNSSNNSNNTIESWNTSDWSQQAISGVSYQPRSMAFSNTERYLAASGGTSSSCLLVLNFPELTLVSGAPTVTTTDVSIGVAWSHS